MPARKAAAKKKAAAKLPAKRRRPGNPTTYNQKTAAQLCRYLAEGQSLRTACKNKGMPAASTVFLWLAKHDVFSEQYARAKEEAADALIEEMLDITDDGTNDWMETHDKEGNCIGYKLNGEHVQRSKLRVDTRKWIASKLKPKKYGDKIQTELTGADGGSVKVEAIQPDDDYKEAVRKFQDFMAIEQTY